MIVCVHNPRVLEEKAEVSTYYFKNQHFLYNETLF